MPYAPYSASLFTATVVSTFERVGGPNGSLPVQPKVQRPNVNLSAGVGVAAMVLLRSGVVLVR